MEFAGREYIYLPKKKIDKLNGYKSEDKKEEDIISLLPQINPDTKLIEKKEDEEISCDSNSVCIISNKFK